MALLTGAARGPLLLACLLWMSCDPGDFDDLGDQAPVRVVGRPANFGGSDFGRVLLPLSPDPDRPKAAGRVGVASAEGAGLAVIELDAGGRTSARVVADTIDGLGSTGVAALAEILDGTPGGSVLLGIPGSGKGKYARLGVGTLKLSGKVGLSSSDASYGIGVATGNVAGASIPDLVILSEENAYLVVDGESSNLYAVDKTDPPCDLKVATEALGERLRRSVVVADLLPGGADEVAVGVPVAAGSGRVAILRWDDAARAMKCGLVLESTGDFDGSKSGQSLAVGDINGDAKPDLVVGAPPARVLVFFGPLAAGPAPALTLEPPDATLARRFGAEVAVADLDGDGYAEVVVGDPAALTGGAAGAGAVYVFRGPTGEHAATLTAREPHENAGYGSALGGLRFCPEPCGTDDGRRLLVVGAADTFSVYFRLAAFPTAPDLR